MKNELAIVIPAYKIRFFSEALTSIFSQTNLNFNLYIGDDSSPEDLYSIVEPYLKYDNVYYKRFDDNLGGVDLVGQWNRCLDLTQGEEWVWLFSDDDIMDRNCVESFYRCISRDSRYDVFHFNINVIDEYNRIIKESRSFPEVMNTNNFIEERSAGNIKSYIVEYIFRRDLLLKSAGFISFPSAWHSDEATVIYASRRNGIKTIVDCKVNWRSSDSNITPNLGSRDVVEKKAQASIYFGKWLSNFVSTNGIRLSWKIRYSLVNRFVYEIYTYNKVFTFKESFRLIRVYLKNIGLSGYYFYSVVKLSLYKLIK